MTACLLCLCLLALPTIAFADTARPVMGDLDGNGKITAGDARKALRMSARLEPTVGVDMLTVDTDGDGKVTAGDARTILRNSAKLCGFARGFDKDGRPCAIDAFISGRYNITLDFEGFEVNIVTDGKNLFINGNSDEFSDLNGELAELLGDFGGIYRVNGKIYFAFIGADGDVSIFTIVSESLVKALEGEAGEPFESFFDEMFNMLPTSVPGDVVRANEDETIDGVTYEVWSSYDATYKTTTRFLTAADGALKKIEVAVDGEAGVSEVEVKSLKADVPTNMFALTSEQVDEAGAIVTIDYLGGHEITKL